MTIGGEQIDELGQAANAENPDSDKSVNINNREWFRRHRTLRYNFVRYLSKVSRGRIKSPHFLSAEKFHKESDVEDIAKARLHTGEHVRSWCLWTVEFYTPDNIQGLYDALGRLQPTMGSGRDSPKDWLQRHRSAAGSSMELHLSTDRSQPWNTGYLFKLPAFAEYGGGSLICVTSSLTIMVMHFGLKAAERTWLDEELHRDHPTKLHQNPDGSISISSPDLEKRRIVHEKRESWLRQATAWYRATFPGLMSLNDEQVPICELSTLEGTIPLTNKMQESKLKRALGLDWSYRMFDGPTGSETNPFKLCQTMTGNGPSGMMLLSTTDEQFRAQDIDGWGNDDDAYVARFDRDFRRTFAMAALPQALQFFARRTAKARDGAASIVGSKNATRALSRVRADTAQCIDASIVARELRDLAARADLGGLRGMEFTSRAERKGQTPIALSVAIRREIKAEAEYLLADVEALNANLNAQANLLGAHANLRLQPLIIWLAAISMLTSAIAAIEPAKELIFPKSATVSAAAPTTNHDIAGQHRATHRPPNRRKVGQGQGQERPLAMGVSGKSGSLRPTRWVRRESAVSIADGVWGERKSPHWR